MNKAPMLVPAAELGEKFADAVYALKHGMGVIAVEDNEAIAVIVAPGEWDQLNGELDAALRKIKHLHTLLDAAEKKPAKPIRLEDYVTTVDLSQYVGGVSNKRSEDAHRNGRLIGIARSLSDSVGHLIKELSDSA